jgi:hypothetical protein
MLSKVCFEKKSKNPIMMLMGVVKNGRCSEIKKAQNDVNEQLTLKKCPKFDGECNDHAAGWIRCKAHRLMECIGGFM